MPEETGVNGRGFPPAANLAFELSIESTGRARHGEASPTGRAAKEARTAKQADAKALIAEVAQASVERFPAIGEGEDLRLRGERVSGGALAVEDRLIHLCAFRLDRGNGETSHGYRPTRLVSASRRRRSRH